MDLMPGLLALLPCKPGAARCCDPEAIAVQPGAAAASFGMDIPLPQRFAAEVPESNRLYVHSLSDAQALVFSDAGLRQGHPLQRGQISDWQTRSRGSLRA